MRRKLFFPFFTVLYCLILYGCSSDSGNPSGDLPTVVLYAHGSTDNGTSSRATIDEYGNIVWSSTDVANVNGNKSTGITITGQVAQFTVAASAPYYALCPAYPDAAYNSTAHTFAFTFPSSQAYNNNTSFSDGVYPLVAVSSSQNLYFSPVCGMMYLQVRAQITGVSKIRFLSADKAVAGAATVDPVAQTLTVSGTTKYMDVTYSSPQNLQLSSPVTYYWVLPVGTYGAGWALQLLDAGDNIIAQQTVNTAITIGRGQWTNGGKFYYTSGSAEAYAGNGNHEGMTYTTDYEDPNAFRNHEGMTNSSGTVSLPDNRYSSSSHEGMTAGGTVTVLNPQYGSNTHEGMTSGSAVTGLPYSQSSSNTHEGMTSGSSVTGLPNTQSTSNTHEGMTTGTSTSLNRVSASVLSVSKDEASAATTISVAKKQTSVRSISKSWKWWDVAPYVPIRNYNSTLK